MVDEVGIIHMNGRIYDPKLGRFLQADPFIQDAFDTQLYNRYSYTRNNPLNATDPSGYFWDEFFTAIKIIAAVVITVACTECGPATFAWVLGSISAIQTAAMGGNIGDIALSAFTSAVMAYAGTQFALEGFNPTEILSFGVMGGITTVLQGGKFGHGFISAGVGTALGNVVRAGTRLGDALKAVGRTIVRSVAGGTISKITGGKFANGALMGAFAYAVGHGVKEFVENNEVGFRTEKAAARAALGKVNEDSIKSGMEYAGLIYKKGDLYFHTAAVPGLPSESYPYSAVLPDGITLDDVTAYYHTHGAPSPGSEVFSNIPVIVPKTSLDFRLSNNTIEITGTSINLVSSGTNLGDIPLAIANQHNAYLATPSNQFKLYDVKADEVKDFGDL
jgi:RHS repeat-associated protein